MAESKRYYWLKLNEDFFEDDTIQWIQEQKNGNDYIIFYIKLLLKSLKDDGKLIRYVGNTLIPYNVEALARLTGTPPDTVRVAMEVFEKIGLISVMDTGEIYLEQINEMIGSETASAKRVRKHRARLAAENKEQSVKALQSNSDVIKCNTDIDIEKDIDTQPEKSKKKKADKEPILILGSQENVKLTDKELGRLKKEYPNDIDEAIEYLSLWIVDKGDKSKAATHNATIRRWVIKAVQEQKERMNYKKQSPLQDELRSWGINE